jgi:diguanylate cyclase (GGDEF)-like protein/PAS domain S-box-containing protein
MASLLKTKRVVWGVIFALVTAVAALSYSSGARYLAAARAVEQALAAQAAIDGALSMLKDAETGQRGFILTGDDQFLAHYDAARSEMPRRMADLWRISGEDSQQVPRLRRLEHLVGEKLAFAEDTVRLRRDGELASAMDLVRGGRGREIMDAIRVESSAMSRREQEMLQDRRQRAATAQSLATWGVSVGTALTILLAFLSLLTVHRDVRTLQRTAEELAAGEEHFRLLTENTSDLVALLDPEGKALYVSPSVERLLGYKAEEFLALPAKNLMHPGDRAAAVSILADVAAGRIGGGISTYRLRNRAGEYRSFEVRWTVQRDTNGAAASIHTTGRDVTEQVHANELLLAQAEQLRALSLRDELTKLYNRRGFMEVAAQAQSLAARDNRPAALIFIDLNGMKRINDELGHDAGDDALVDAATVLGRALRESDVLARLGGDEFVAFALDFTAFHLEGLRVRVRALADVQTKERARPYRLSMSVGAAYSETGSRKALPDLLEEADAAMYRQKRARHAAGDVSTPPTASHDAS